MKNVDSPLRALVLSLSLIATPAIAAPADTGHDPTIDRIVDEGMNRSQVMVMASELMDGVGPRLTNSDNFYRAEKWALDKYNSWHLAGVHTEQWKFGLGWNLDSSSATMVSPRRVAMLAIPIAWSPPTDGIVTAPVVVAPMSREENFAAWKGKLAGKIVLVTLPREPSDDAEPQFSRFTEADFAKMDRFTLPRHDPEEQQRGIERRTFQLKLSRFLKDEGAKGMLVMSRQDNGLIHGEGYSYNPGDTLAVPAFEVGAEDYRRLVRLAQTGREPQVALETRASYVTDRQTSDNIFAEIPGSDPKAGYVMAGGHFDSWIAADGASDNGAGSLVVMEAARILQTLGVKPKRTIRFALWSGEEQGLLGSLNYIEQHLASRPIPGGQLGSPDAYYAWRNAFPITPKPGYYDLKAYFNIDNGSGKFRGIYAENNIGAEPLLRKWLAPFAMLDADRVVAQKSGGTDHVFMQAVGLPAYQFIQDPLGYDSNVHHTNLDTVDHMRADDLRQAAVVMAGMLWQAANSDQTLPKSPLPTQPAVTDPFKVSDPNK